MWIVWFGNLSGSAAWICLCKRLLSAHYRSLFPTVVAGICTWDYSVSFTCPTYRQVVTLTRNFFFHPLCPAFWAPSPPSLKLSVWWTVAYWYSPSCLSSASIVFEARVCWHFENRLPWLIFQFLNLTTTVRSLCRWLTVKNFREILRGHSYVKKCVFFT